MARTYVIRRFQNGKNASGEPFFNYSITVPTPLATRLPKGMKYACEVLPEIELPDNKTVPEHLRGRAIKGLLFIPEEMRPPRPELPEWAKSNGTTKPSRARRRPGATDN